MIGRVLLRAKSALRVYRTAICVESNCPHTRATLRAHCVAVYGDAVPEC